MFFENFEISEKVDEIIRLYPTYSPTSEVLRNVTAATANVITLATSLNILILVAYFTCLIVDRYKNLGTRTIYNVFL